MQPYTLYIESLFNDDEDMSELGGDDATDEQL